MKLEQRLAELTRQLADARRDGDQDLIEELEDKIFEVEDQLEAEMNERFTEWDD